jgi:hypothetical protein
MLSVRSDGCLLCRRFQVGDEVMELLALNGIDAQIGLGIHCMNPA